MAAEIDQLSNTDKNLWRAIVSEALANLKYNAYAIKAMEEGLPEVAQVFQEVSGAETIHGINHLRVSGEIGTSLENLRAVSAEESKEFSSFYPRMIKEAIEEGQTDAANSFSVAMEREIHHLDMFSRTLERLEAKQTAQLRPAAPAAPVITLPPTTEEVKDTSIQPAEAPPKLAEIANLETYVTAAMEVDRERGRVANLGRLREVVFGAQDGILSTVALVTSVAVAVGDTSVVLVAGLAAAFAGMVSMATGAFLGSRAELDVQRSEIAREARELEDHPAEELAELVFMFQREGHTYAEAQDMANEISMDKDLWLRTLLEKELGISMDETTNPDQGRSGDGVLIHCRGYSSHRALPVPGRHRGNKRIDNRRLAGPAGAWRGQRPVGAKVSPVAGPGNPRDRRVVSWDRLCPGRRDPAVDQPVRPVGFP